MSAKPPPPTFLSTAGPESNSANAGTPRPAGGLTLAVPDEALDVLAQRVAGILSAREPAGPEPWIGVEEAAQHIDARTSRIYALTSAGRIPFERDGSRLLFRRTALDKWIEAGGGRRP